MTCWFCGIPLSEPYPGTLVLEGMVHAAVCKKHSKVMTVALKGLWGFRHFARVWVEKRAEAAAAKAQSGAQSAKTAAGSDG